LYKFEVGFNYAACKLAQTTFGRLPASATRRGLDECDVTAQRDQHTNERILKKNYQLLLDWLVACLFCWLLGHLIGWSADGSFDWLIG
jgi:hypothetical protein